MANSAGSCDTNVVLRLLLNDIPEQHIAAKKLLEESDGQMSIADAVIIELVFGLDRYYDFNRTQIVEAVDGLMRLKEINCNRELFNKALPIFLSHPALSFEDCCLASYATIDGAGPLWTFSKKLANQVPDAKLISS